MSANPIDKNSTPKPTGSLEELFRHHLGEEAAMPPRPLLWDQIDNSLLIRQNETYRKRLVVTRWVAAASLLLASLAGTGWWAHRAADQAGAGLAHNGPAPARQSEVDPSAKLGYARIASRVDNAPFTERGLPATGLAATQAEVKNPQPSRSSARPNAYTAARPAASSIRGAVAAGLAPEAPVSAGQTGISRMNGAGPSGAMQGSSPAPAAALAARTPQAASADEESNASFRSNQGTRGLAANATVAAGISASGSALGGASAAGAASLAVATLSPAATAVGIGPMGLLAAQPTALSLTTLASLPTGLAQVSLPETVAPPAVADARKWHYSASYAASIFNPNVNFSRVGGDGRYAYNASSAYGENTVALTEAAAAQYRENLRPGLSQRLALLATRHLPGRWSVSTGVEFAQAAAKSATTSAFVGEQVLDLGQARNSPLRTTDYRYRMASIPLEVRYSNPIKRGWSLYGRLGGVVSALLGVRGEVAGYPEATRSYTIASAGAPYRRVLGSLRGATGAQFRPTTGNWALTLGPVAELGLVPLNAHPTQSYLAQSRPYSLGMEAAVEFGR